MLVSRKIALMQITLICSFIGAVLIMAHLVWGQNYLMLEQDAVKGNVVRADLAWEEEVNTLISLVGDWSPWDDLYSFAHTPENREFVEKNLPDSAMANLKISTAVVTDIKGRALFAKTIDLDTREEIETSPELLSQINRLIGSGFLTQDNEQSLSGFVLTSSGPVLIAVQQVLTSEKTGPSPGYLVFGKMADTRLLQELSRRTQVETALYNSNGSTEGKKEELYQEVIGSETIKTYHMLSDLFGEGSYYLVTATPRVIYAQWQTQMKSFLLLVSGFGLLFISITLVALNKVILARIQQMSMFMNALIRENNFSERLSLGGNDELSHTAAVLNKMLDQIEDSQQALRYIGLHDSLTGLYNRAYFEQQIKNISVRPIKSVGVVCFDLDGLKLINDTLGHAAGDNLLIQAAAIIAGVFDDGVVARIGGDEFAILLCNVTEDDLLQGCQKIKSQIQKYETTDNSLGLTLSMGWKYFQGGVLDEAVINNLLKQADDMMYRNKLSSSHSNRSALVQGMLEMLKVRDYITEGHSQRLQEIALGIGKKAGLSEAKLTELCLLAQFHDIGKVGISDRILLKPGALTTAERIEMNRHSEIGHRIAQSIPELLPIADLILKHHEWWNGQGYPLGLQGAEIPIEDRILSIADAYDAMTNNRPYRAAMSDSEALAELERCAGTQFDPILVETMIQIIRQSSKDAG